MKKETKILFIKAMMGFIAWLAGTIWLFNIDYRIGLAVTLITLSIYNDLKLFITNRNNL